MVVAVNAFDADTPAELAFLEGFCKDRGCGFAVSRVWEKGGAGGVQLAQAVLKTISQEESHFEPLYDVNLPIQEKMDILAREIYGADGVDYSDGAQKQIGRLTELGFGNLPICVAKTQYSLSDNPKRLGRPGGFRISVREASVSAGAGFVVLLTGSVMTMPGLPKNPAANRIDVEDDGRITGLF